MRMEQRLQALCTICDEPITDHADWCIELLIQKECEKQVRLCCPNCHEFELGINAMDFYECRKCHTQFCAGPVSGGENPDELKRTHILTDNGAIPALVMRTPGDGKFPHDQYISELCKKRDDLRIKSIRLRNLRDNLDELFHLMEDLTALGTAAAYRLEEVKADTVPVEAEFPQGDKFQTRSISEALRKTVEKALEFLKKLDGIE
jgi:hypothetical protein